MEAYFKYQYALVFSETCPLKKYKLAEFKKWVLPDTNCIHASENANVL